MATSGFQPRAPSMPCSTAKPGGGPRHRARGTPLSPGTAPNDLWCADYKGEFKLGNGRYCYPLTVTDQASRFLLLCEALESTREELVFTAFERLFRERGLPLAIRSDNARIDLSVPRPRHSRHRLRPHLPVPQEDQHLHRARRPAPRHQGSRRRHLARQLQPLRSRIFRSGAEDPATSRQPVRPEVVTHVLGTVCYPCLRAGHGGTGGGGG